MAFTARKHDKRDITPLERFMKFSLQSGGFRRETLAAILDDIRMDESDIDDFIRRENRMLTWQQAQETASERAERNTSRQVRKNALRHFSIDLMLCAGAIAVGAMAMGVGSMATVETQMAPSSVDELVTVLRDLRDNGMPVYEPMEAFQQ